MSGSEESSGAAPTVEALIGFDGTIHVVDIGAAAINEAPIYKGLVDRGLARLTAVDGDERQQAGIQAAFPEARCLSVVLGDGKVRPLHLASPASGMSSLLKPSPRHLDFFNGFSFFGAVKQVVEVETVRMADVAALHGLDFLKMDIQGAELMVLDHAGDALDACVAIQLEASFVPLYEGQPSLGDVDLWMRGRGFLPHCMVDLKRWSIAPTMRGNDPRLPFNQLIECDIVYVRGLVELETLSVDQLRKLVLIAAYAYGSPDLAVRAVFELQRRGAAPKGIVQQVAKAVPPASMPPRV